LSRKVVSRTPGKSYLSTKLDNRLRKKIIAYFKTMGVDEALLAMFNKAPPSSMYMIPLKEAQSTKLVTGVISAVDLVGNKRCMTDSPAENCILMEPTAKSPEL
jgi:hypothetical protein